MAGVDLAVHLLNVLARNLAVEVFLNNQASYRGGPCAASALGVLDLDGQRYLAMRDKSYAYIASLGWALTAPTLGPRPAPEANRRNHQIQLFSRSGTSFQLAPILLDFLRFGPESV